MAQMKYFYELTISSSPHAHAPLTTRVIMRNVLIALVPALLGSIYFFDLHIDKGREESAVQLRITAEKIDQKRYSVIF